MNVKRLFATVLAVIFTLSLCVQGLAQEAAPADTAVSAETVLSSESTDNVGQANETPDASELSGDSTEAPAEESTEAPAEESTEAPAEESADESSEELPVSDDTETPAPDYYEVHFGDEQQVTIQGGGSTPLAEILAALGITGEVTAASGSNDALFTLSQDENGQWMFNSHNAFSIEQTMTLVVDGEEVVVRVTDDNVMLVSTGSGSEHSSIEAAITAAGNADDITIALKEDYASAVTIDIENEDATVTIDLKGFTLSNTITLTKGNLTITDSGRLISGTSDVIKGSVQEINAGTYASVSVQNAEVATINGEGSVITVKDGSTVGDLNNSNTVTGEGESEVVIFGNATIEGGTVDMLNNSGTAWVSGNVVNVNNTGYGGVIVQNGAIIGDKDSDVYNDSVVSSDNATLIINGGAIMADIETYDSSKLIINGGVFDCWVDTYDNSTLTILGGEFNDEIDMHDNSTATVKGGIFRDEVETRDNSTMVIDYAIFSDGDTWTSDLNARDSSSLTINGGSFDLQMDSRDNATITVNGGGFTQKTESRENSKLIINDGTFTDVVSLYNSELTINGGNFSGGVSEAVYAQDNSKLTINGGVVATAYAQDSSTLTINNGSVANAYAQDSSKLTINGGVLVNAYAQDSSKLTIAQTKTDVQTSIINVVNSNDASAVMTGGMVSSFLNAFNGKALLKGGKVYELVNAKLISAEGETSNPVVVVEGARIEGLVSNLGKLILNSGYINMIDNLNYPYTAVNMTYGNGEAIINGGMSDGYWDQEGAIGTTVNGVVFDHGLAVAIPPRLIGRAGLEEPFEYDEEGNPISILSWAEANTDKDIVIKLTDVPESATLDVDGLPENLYFLNTKDHSVFINGHEIKAGETVRAIDLKPLEPVKSAATVATTVAASEELSVIVRDVELPEKGVCDLTFVFSDAELTLDGRKLALTEFVQDENGEFVVTKATMDAILNSADGWKLAFSECKLLVDDMEVAMAEIVSDENGEMIVFSQISDWAGVSFEAIPVMLTDGSDEKQEIMAVSMEDGVVRLFTTALSFAHQEFVAQNA